MKTSVIITVYNRPDMLMACLRALALQRPAPDEVVVSDDGSNEASVSRMKEAFPTFPFPVRYVWQEDRGYRLAAARNHGIRQAAGEVLLFVDCDILLLPGALAVHLRQARPGRFLAGNRGLMSQASTQSMLHGPMTDSSLDAAWETADRNHLPRAHRQFVRNLWLRRFGLARRHKPKILGCHFSLFREDIRKVNGFDEHYEGWGLEDDDLSLRLHQAGVKGQSVIPEARALHLWHASVDSKAPALRESPNWLYFQRRPVPTFCEKGLAGVDRG